MGFLPRRPELTWLPKGARECVQTWCQGGKGKVRKRLPVLSTPFLFTSTENADYFVKI
jgi:hypothetical protein